MRPLLSRVGLVIALLAVALLTAKTAPVQPSLVAQSASLTLPNPGLASEPTPRVQTTPTPIATPPPTPAPTRRAAVAARPAKPKTTAAPKAPAQPIIGTGQWGLINRDRASAGLPPLQWNACLANVAVGQAQRMAAQGYISHANGRALDLACHLGNRASESIGLQYGHIDDAAMNAWFMGDGIHRDNIMGPYHWVGTCWVAGANNRFYLAIEFG